MGVGAFAPQPLRTRDAKGVCMSTAAVEPTTTDSATDPPAGDKIRNIAVIAHVSNMPWT